jgi:hypothetical protein
MVIRDAPVVLTLATSFKLRPADNLAGPEAGSENKKPIYDK